MSNLIYRLTKGSPLTNEEVDGNFRHLEDKVENLGDVADLNTTNEEGKFLSASGEWEHIPKYSLATEQEDGLMSSQDKVGLFALYEDYIDKYNTLTRAIQLVYTEDITIPSDSTFEVSYGGVVWRREVTIPKNTPVFIRNVNGSSELHNLFQRQYISEIIYWGRDIVSLSSIGGTALSKVPLTIPESLNYMSGMFEGCSNFNQDISMWTVGANIYDMSGMFYECSAFNQDLSSWNGTNAWYDSFALGAGFENNPEKHPLWETPIEFEVWREDLPPKFIATAPAQGDTFYEKDGLWFYVAPVTTNESQLWHLKSVLEPFTNLEGDFPTADITDKTGVTRPIPLNQIVMTFVSFHSSDYYNRLMDSLGNWKFNQYIGSWDLSNLTDISRFFNGCSSFNQPLDLNLPNCTYASNFLSGCSSFNQPLEINLPNCTDASSFLYNCSSFDQPIDINLPECTNAGSFLYNCKSFNQPLEINLPNCTDVNNFLSGCSNFNQPLEINLPNCYFANSFLSGCSNFNQPLEINLPNCTNASGFLQRCSSFDQDISNACVPKLTSAPSSWNRNTAYSFQNDTSKHPVWGTCPSN